MGDIPKGAQKLPLSADGKSADNWGAYAMQVENLLMGKEIGGLFCDDVLRNEGDGKKSADPGHDVADWIAGAANGETRDVAAYDAAFTKFRRWRRVNEITHGVITGTLPVEIQDDAAQRADVRDLWCYLKDRFARQTLVSVPILHARLFATLLHDFPNISAYLTSFAKIEGEIKAAGGHVDQSAVAGAILNGIGNAFPFHRTLMTNLPAGEQTPENLGCILTEAEKNEILQQQLALLTVHKTGGELNAAGKSRPFCSYVRQRQGRQRWEKPGKRCRGGHNPLKCWAKRDDEWLKGHPDKGPADTPVWDADGQNVVSTSNAATLCDADAADMNNADYSQYFNEYSGPVHKTIRLVLDNGASITCLKQGTNCTALHLFWSLQMSEYQHITKGISPLSSTWKESENHWCLSSRFPLQFTRSDSDLSWIYNLCPVLRQKRQTHNEKFSRL